MSTTLSQAAEEIAKKLYPISCKERIDAETIIALDATLQQILKERDEAVARVKDLESNNRYQRGYDAGEKSMQSQLSQWQEVGKECLETNGGPIDGADTLDGNDYAMVKMETFLKLQKLYTNLIGQNKEPK